MDSLWQTFGHNQIKNILSRQLNSAIFPHAYLFAGVEGVGKKTLALEFAQKVLKTEALEKHPDFQILDIEGEITMEPALEFIRNLSLKPFVGEKKVAIINNAHNLNIQSSNALLKTLEEPSPSTIIVLIANSRGLLPTIVSRCQVFNMNSFSDPELKAFADLQKMPVSREILGLSYGRISKLKQLAEDKDFLEKEKAVLLGFMKIVGSKPAEKLISITEFAELETEDLEKNLLSWLSYQYKRITEQPEEYTKLQALVDALNGLKRNLNKKLVLQALFLKI